MNTSSRPGLGALLTRFRVPLLLLALLALAAFLYYRYRDYDFKWGLFIETFSRMNWWCSARPPG